MLKDITKLVCMLHLFGRCTSDKCQRRHDVKRLAPAVLNSPRYKKLLKEHGEPKGVILPKTKPKQAGSPPPETSGDDKSP